MTLPHNSLWNQRLSVITSVVADYYGFQSDNLFQRRLPRELVRARRVVVYLIRMAYTDITLRSVSQFFRGSPTLACDDLTYLTRDMATDKRLCEDIRQLQQRINGASND